MHKIIGFARPAEISLFLLHKLSIFQIMLTRIVKRYEDNTKQNYQTYST
jgi:hypothetical protein